MKALFISRHSLHPPTCGAAQRSDIICRSLATFAEVDLVVISDKVKDPEAVVTNCRLADYIHIYPENIHPYPLLHKICPLLAKFRLACSPRYGFHPSPEIVSRIHKVINQGRYDLIVVRYLVTFSQCNLAGCGKVIVDIDDLPLQIFQTMIVDKGKWLKKMFLQFKQRGIARHTHILAAQCQHVWLPNLGQVKDFPNASWLPNIPYPFFPRTDTGERNASERRKRVLFVGLMNYLPNQEAMAFYVGKVWSKVQAVIPDAELQIVGGGLPAELKSEWERLSGVHVVGYMENLAAEYQNCAMAVAPIFSGGGTSIKVLEAMSYGIACVISPFVGKGLSDVVRNGETALIGSTPDEFARHTIALLRDEALCFRIGEAGSKVIRKFYSFETICNEVKRTIQAIMHN